MCEFSPQTIKLLSDIHGSAERIIIMLETVMLLCMIMMAWIGN